MKRLPYFQSELKQFPWGRLESDGTCNHDLLKARFRVLGSGPKFGYWSLPGGRRPHDETSSQRGIRPGEMRSNYTAGYVHGEVLLGNKWPSDIEAWKLKDSKLVPKLVFDGESKPPPQPTADQVKDWKSWYEWRGLDVASPAAILMDFPLSVFYLVTKVLNLVDPSGTPEHRQKLTIHYIGAEVELNFLPLFSELALLMPNTDITLIFFGNAVANLVHRARREYPNSLATRDFVWEYKAPEISGGGSLKIQLYSESGTWSEEVLEGPDGEIGREELPDALVGLNAGIASYPEWTTPLKFAAMFDIPFAITEYAEQTIRQLARDLPAVLESMGMQYESIYPPPDDPLIDNLFKRRAHTVTVNPFHRPGQRPLAHVRSPNLYNGFAVPIVPNSKSSPS
ncbi:hypothetical protein SISNIDRAFT_480037 [Sistotremastrum niveocremeum HHB9708]|uniref:Mitochondrial splicing suppressor 51-like C-terminal domain-containing protein n=2 Tax=Sistotremastraceae TaxID=3402574 RepID=A0A164NVT6_9AGAM|nr:hypothetical protein SISNIDRAFT_480037 [Sistotremastrum niveocremeum HHB9708]KZT40484.1 hypothetical protein SISSUDRAFT_1118279 [Sistotremastrum suecicum HHB10207 ss-3]